MPSPLTQEQRKEFRITLKQRYRDLWSDVQRELAAAEPYRELAGETHDAEDEATADVLVDINLADIHRDICEMRDIEAALQRLAGGNYGECVDCSSDIGLERLRAYPTAERCQPCQRQYEHLHVRRSGTTL
jgi:RNA polymerase-binding protein DksA